MQIKPSTSHVLFIKTVIIKVTTNTIIGIGISRAEGAVHLITPLDSL